MSATRTVEERRVRREETRQLEGRIANVLRRYVRLSCSRPRLFWA